MMRTLRRIVTGVAMIAGILIVVPTAGALDLSPICSDPNIPAEQKAGCSVVGENKLGQNGNASLVMNGIRTALIALGSIAVLMIVIGGFKYVTSQGDPNHIKAAKETILYSVIGLIVAILSFAVVQAVASRFS